MSDGADDRRDNPRNPIELKVEYKRVNTFFADYTKNISRGGTFIRTEKPLDLGTEFVFALSVPQLGEPVKLIGRVQWITTVADASTDKPAGMGIRFVYKDDDERTAMERHVERLMNAELGEQLSGKLLGRK